MVPVRAVQRTARAAAGAEKYLDRFDNIENRKPPHVRGHDVGDGRCGRQDPRQGSRHGPGREHAHLLPLRQRRADAADHVEQQSAARLQSDHLGRRHPRSVLLQWKGQLPAGKTYDHPIIQLDILPTALAAAGAHADPEWKLDGVNLLPYLTGKNEARPHETLYWRFGNQWAIRHGDWKLVGRPQRPGRRALQPGRRHQRIKEPRRRQARQSRRAQNALRQMERRTSPTFRAQGTPQPPTPPEPKGCRLGCHWLGQCLLYIFISQRFRLAVRG